VVTARLARLDHERAPVGIVREHARVEVAERADHRAGQGREVDEMSGAEPARIGERVGEDKTALGVRVDDLDRLSVHCGQDVAGTEGAAPNRVLGGTDDADDAERCLELCERAERRDDRAAARHIALHVLHVERLLDRAPAGVEGDRLADEAEDDVAPRLRRLVTHDDQVRRVVAALGDAGERPHPELADLLEVERFRREQRRALGDVSGAFCQGLRRQLVRRGVG
jgi:hypothetical protein